MPGQQTQEQVLGPDLPLAERDGLTQRPPQGRCGPRRDGHGATGAPATASSGLLQRAGPELGLGALHHGLEVDSEVSRRGGVDLAQAAVLASSCNSPAAPAPPAVLAHPKVSQQAGGVGIGEQRLQEVLLAQFVYPLLSGSP